MSYWSSLWGLDWLSIWFLRIIGVGLGRSISTNLAATTLISHPCKKAIRKTNLSLAGTARSVTCFLPCIFCLANARLSIWRWQLYLPLGWLWRVCRPVGTFFRMSYGRAIWSFWLLGAFITVGMPEKMVSLRSVFGRRRDNDRQLCFADSGRMIPLQNHR